MRYAAILAVLGMGTFGCTRTTELFPSLTATCTAPGPIVHLGGTDDTSCAGAIAARLGRYALCTCDDLLIPNNLNVAPLPSAPGTRGPGPAPPDVPPTPTFAAPVGSDGSVQVSGSTKIAGSLVSAGASDLVLGGGGLVGGNFHASAGLTTNAMNLLVLGDAYVGGAAVNGGVDVQGTLHVPADTVLAPEAQAHDVIREAVSVDAPCQCASGPVFDIPGAVTTRQEKNANDTLSFPVSQLADVTSNETLDLGCGEYYVPRVQTENGTTLTFRVHGHVGVFVSGDVQFGGNFVVSLDTDAEFDLVIAGSLYTTGRVFGSPASPVRTRLWVGSTTVSLPPQIQFGAAVYAPSAVLSAGAGMIFGGTLFVGTLSVDGDVHIAYDATATSAGQNCGASAPSLVE